MRPVIRATCAANAGMTLFECLTYIAIFTVLINVSASTFISTTQLASIGTRGLDRLNMTDELRDDVSRLLREARAVTSGAGAYHTGPDTLVLEMPSPPDSANTHRYTVLGGFGPKNRLARIDVSEKDGVHTVTWFSHYALPVASVKFAYDNADPLQARLINVEANVVNTHKGRSPIPYRFSAALRSRVTGGAA